VTRIAEDLIPEGYDLWPRAIQRQYWRELHALYFPEQHGRAPDPLLAGIPEAEVVADP
jgi:hypothetical protein